MSTKTLAELAGKTGAALASVRSQTSPRDRKTPFVVQPPATKLFGYGENITYESLNRSLGALAENDDYLSSYLYTAYPRHDTLTYLDFSALTIASNTDTIDLSAGGADPVWVFCGLTIGYDDNFIVTAANVTSVEDLSVQSAKGSVYSITKTGLPAGPYYSASLAFRNPGYIDSDINLIPPVEEYTAGTNIGTWHVDGVELSTQAFVDPSAGWAARPGTLIKIEGSGVNNGLYMVKETTYNRATLVNCGLHRISYENLSGGAFQAGQLIEWNAPGNSSWENKGYIAHLGTDELWIATSSRTDRLGRSNTVGMVGSVYREDSASYFHYLPVGTTIRASRNNDFIAPYITADVVEVTPSGSPVVFDTSAATGTAKMCNPVGYALNPVLTLERNLPAGDYSVRCKTLSTFREILQSQGTTSFYHSDTPMPMGFTGWRALTSAIASMKYDATSPGSFKLGWMGKPRQRLGDSYWLVTLDVVVNAGWASVGDTVTFTDGTITTTGDIAGFWDANTLIISDIERTAGTVEDSFIDNTMTATSGASGPDNVTTVVAPATPYPPGLNAAYNQLFSSSTGEQGSGKGNEVDMTSGKPITLYMETTGDVAHVVKKDGNYTLIEHQNTAGTSQASLGSSVGEATLNDTKHASAQTLQSLVNLESQFLAGVVSGMAYTTYSDPNASFTAGVIYSNGKRIEVGALSVALTPSADNYVYYDVSAGALAVHNAASFMSGGGTTDPYLYKIAVDATPVVTATVDLRMMHTYHDQRAHMFVGAPAGPVPSSLNGFAHYETISDAVDAINVYVNDPVTNFAQTKFYTIDVVGYVDETGTTSIPIPVDGLHVKGHGGTSAQFIEWDTALFDLNGKDGLVFDGLHFSFTGVAAGGTNPVNLIWSGSSSVTDLSITNCTSAGGESGVWLTSGCEGLTFVDNRLAGLTNAAVITQGAANDVRVENNDLSCSTPGATNYRAAVSLEECIDAFVDGNTIDGFEGAVKAVAHASASGGELKISRNTVKNSTGIAVNVSADYASIVDNTVHGNSGSFLLTGGGTSGILIRDNKVFGAGMDCVINTQYCRFISNTFDNDQDLTLDSSAIESVISQNLFTSGNVILTSGCADTRISLNTLRSGTLVVNTADKIFVHDNTLASSGATFSSDGCIVHHNDFGGDVVLSGEGVEFDGNNMNGNDITVSGNQCSVRGNLLCDTITLSTVNRVSLDANTFESGATGVAVTSSDNIRISGVMKESTGCVVSLNGCDDCTVVDSEMLNMVLTNCTFVSIDNCRMPGDITLSGTATDISIRGSKFDNLSLASGHNRFVVSTNQLVGDLTVANGVTDLSAVGNQVGGNLTESVALSTDAVFAANVVVGTTSITNATSIGNI